MQSALSRENPAKLARLRTPRDQVLYRYFDHDGVLLYIGITVNASARKSAHATSDSSNLSTRWWKLRDPSRDVAQTYRSRVEVELAEAVAIRGERPKFNLQIPSNERIYELAMRISSDQDTGLISLLHAALTEVAQEYQIASSSLHGLRRERDEYAKRLVKLGDKEWVRLTRKEWANARIHAEHRVEGRRRHYNAVEAARASVDPLIAAAISVGPTPSPNGQRTKREWIERMYQAIPRGLTTLERHRVRQLLQKELEANGWSEGYAASTVASISGMLAFEVRALEKQVERARRQVALNKGHLQRLKTTPRSQQDYYSKADEIERLERRIASEERTIESTTELIQEDLDRHGALGVAA